MRRALLALGAALIILCPATIAGALPAQDEALVADDVAEFGVFIEEGVEDAYDIALDIDAIDRAVADVRASGQDGGLVILSADASDHASLEAFTDATFAELSRRGAAVDTLVVVTPNETWAVTSSSSGSVDAALDASSPDFFAGDFVDGYRAFFAVVEPADAATTPTAAPDVTAAESDTDSGGGIGWFLPVLLIGGLGLIGFLFWRSRRAKQQQIELDMDTARAELRDETTAASDLIWELSEKITEAPQDVQLLFEEASDTFQEVGEQSQTVTTPPEMQELIRRLGRATWQLEVVEARIEGRPPPPEPTPEQIEVPVRENPPPPPEGRRPPPPAPVPPVLRRSRGRKKSGLWDVLGPAIGGAAAGSIFRTRSRSRAPRPAPRSAPPRSSGRGDLGGPVLGGGSSSPPRRKVTVEEANRGSRPSGSASSRSSRSSKSSSKRSSSGRVRSAGRMRDRVRSAGRRRSR
jgi:hypothetical protein